LFNLFINDIFTGFSDLEVKISNDSCCGGFFADDKILCAPTRSNLRKMLKKVNKWAIYNNMKFDVNKCATMVVRPDTLMSRSKRDPIFYIAGQQIPTTDYYTYLGIPFDKYLSLDSVLKILNNSERKALFLIGGFLRNPRIYLPFKKTIINYYIISKVSYFVPLLESNKKKSKEAQKINKYRSILGCRSI